MSRSAQERASVRQETTKKKAYLKPELKEYGTVSQLTRGAAGTLGDGHNGKMKL